MRGTDILVGSFQQKEVGRYSIQEVFRSRKWVGILEGGFYGRMRIDILLGRKKLDISVGSFKSRELGDVQVGNSTVGGMESGQTFRQELLSCGERVNNFERKFSTVESGVYILQDVFKSRKGVDILVEAFDSRKGKYSKLKPGEIHI